MATSICKAQTPLSCQLCSIQRVIKWKCTECELLMCDICKTTVHSRIKTAEKHNIITIQEVGNNLSERLKALYISDVFSSVVNTYTTDLVGIHKMICCAEDIIYFMNNRPSTYHFRKAQLLKSSVKILQKMDIECIDFATSWKEEILFSPLPRNKLLAVSTTKTKLKTIFKTSEHLITAIHKSKHDELLISFREQGPKLPLRDLSTRKVSVFGTDYKHKFTLDRDGTGKRLFNYTSRIATDSANNIYVLDRIEVDLRRGKIMSIDRSGRKRFVYNGCTSFNTHEAAFNPEDIVVTWKDTTIISDSKNHALHVLNQNGDLLGLQITRNFDILYPDSLCIDNEGFLLIGTGSSSKIHVVKLSP